MHPNLVIYEAFLFGFYLHGDKWLLLVLVILDAIYNGAGIVSRYGWQDEAFIDRVSENGIESKLCSI